MMMEQPPQPFDYFLLLLFIFFCYFPFSNVSGGRGTSGWNGPEPEPPEALSHLTLSLHFLASPCLVVLLCWLVFPLLFLLFIFRFQIY